MTYAIISNNNNGSGVGSVSLIDTSTDTVSYTLTLGNLPDGVAVTPDGTKAYVVNNFDGTVSVIDLTASPPAVKTGTGYPIAVGTTPYGIAITPDGTKAYVANINSPSVSVINTSNDTVSGTIPFASGATPTGVALTPDGTKAYVTNNNDASVTVINTFNDTVLATVAVGSGPFGIAITPDGTKAYVVNNGSGTVTVIDVATNTPKSGANYPISVGSDPYGIGITPDGTTAYVTNYGSGNVTVIDTSTDIVSTTLTVGAHPIGVAVTPDGVTAYVANEGSNTVSPITVATNTVGTAISVGNLPTAFGQFIQPGNIPMTNTYSAPQGRLTLTSNTPVMSADVTGASSVYYAPYQGNIVPIYDGANMDSYTFGQLTMALNTSNQTNGNIYDLFIFLNSSVVTIGAGPAWSSSTSRGTGTGTTQLQQTDGLWVNANTITLTNGSNTYSSIPVGQATYVGSVYMTANGQTGMQFKPAGASGGASPSPTLGLYNAYNRVRTFSSSSDTTSEWNYATATWRAANNSNNNRISFVDGLQQSPIDTSYTCAAETSSESIGALIGVCLNSTSATPVNAPFTANTAEAVQLKSQENFDPQLGFNYIQAMEYSSGSTSYFYGSPFGSVNSQALQISLDM